MERQKVILAAAFVFSVATLTSFVYFNSGDTPNDDVSELEELDGEYSYDQTVSADAVQVSFEVTKDGNIYSVSRSDTVPNPSSSLEVKKAYIVGDTLVIEEEFVDTSDEDTVAPTVISYASYEKSWEISDANIKRVAVEHPHHDNPYVKELE